MKTLVFLLEGRSEKAFLEGFLPRAFPAINDPEKFAPLRFITFDGKRDLRRQLCRKIRGWGVPNSTFVVLQDQDSGDCREAKKELLKKCGTTGKQADCVVRIACRELENWYLGDLVAVGEVYQCSLAQHYRKTRFRDIDVMSGAHELEKITNMQYAKIDGSRRIAQHIDVNYQMNKSHSFQVFCQGIEKVMRE